MRKALPTVKPAAGVAHCERRRVDCHAAVHVVGVLAAVEHEGALIDDCTGNAAIRGNTGLEGNEGGGVALNRGKVLKEIATDSIADRCVEGLQLSAGCNDFNTLRDGPNVERYIQGESEADTNDLLRELGHAKTGLSNRNVIRAGRDVYEYVPTGFICNGSALDVCRGVCDGNRGSGHRRPLSIEDGSCDGTGVRRLRK